MSFTIVTVAGTYLRGPEQTPATGDIEFRYTAAMQDQLGNVIASTTPIVVTLDATGSFSVGLPATDDTGVVPSGVAVQVTERIEDAAERRYRVLLAKASPSVNLADLSPAVPQDPVFQYSLVGHTHPGGGGDLNVVIVFGVPTTPWPIPHNMGKFPAIEIVDSTNRVVGCQVDHVDVNNAVATPAGAMSGKAVCN